MVKFGPLLALTLKSALSQTADDEDLTLSSGDYQLESSSDGPIEKSSPTTVSVQTSLKLFTDFLSFSFYSTLLPTETLIQYLPETKLEETELDPLVLYGAIGAGVLAMIAITALIVVKYCNPKDTGSYAPGQTKENLP